MTEYDHLMRMVVARHWETEGTADYRLSVDDMIGEPEFRRFQKRHWTLMLAVDMKIEKIGMRA